MIFNSLEEPIPPLRTDLEFIPYEEGDEQLLILRDPIGYGSEMIVVKPEAWALFSLFDGRQTISELQREIFKATEVHIKAEQILEVVHMLDKYYFLHSSWFLSYREEMDAEFLSAKDRPAIHAGASYPEDPAELKEFLDGIFAEDTTELPKDSPIGIIAPHIDMRIGPHVYVPPFRHLKEANGYDTVVILGTSHYSSEDLYILTRKHFETPLGKVETDTEVVDAFYENTNGTFTQSDIAHRQEHSIEFPAVFLKYLLKKKVKVVPVLVTSFEECIKKNVHPNTLPKYSAFIEGFSKALKELGRKPIYVLSIDWSHVGLKFGDEEPAQALLSVTEESDRKQLNLLEQCDYEGFRAVLVDIKNATKIDGFSCISTFFDLVSPSSGKLLIYDQWHEEERQSGVTFAGMSFFK